MTTAHAQTAGQGAKTVERVAAIVAVLTSAVGVVLVALSLVAGPTVDPSGLGTALISLVPYVLSGAFGGYALRRISAPKMEPKPNTGWARSHPP